MMAYLFIIDPIESLNKIKDSSLLLMKESLRMNIEVPFYEINQFSIYEGNVNIHSQKIISLEKGICLLYTSPSPRDAHESRMPSSA